MRIVVFRVDASTDIGTGHVMRCLALAYFLRKSGASVVFVCREHDGHLCDVIEQQGYLVLRLTGRKPAAYDDQLSTVVPTLGVDYDTDAAQTIAAIASLDVKPAWLVVDHYAIERRWELTLRPWVDRIMVIDDLADRMHDCDVLLDQNLHEDSEALYETRVPPHARRFFGPRYAILRPEFDEPRLLRVRDGIIRRMLVFFGGTDPGNQTARVLCALALLRDSAPEVIVVLGPTNPNRDAVFAAANGMRRVVVLEATDRMAQLTADADIGIGVCGIAAWERCVLGLPSLVTISAENQRDDARMLHALGACQNLGDACAISEQDWLSAIQWLTSRPADVVRMGAAARRVLAGRTQAQERLHRVLISD